MLALSGDVTRCFRLHAIKTIFEHRYVHALAKSAAAEGIELLNLSDRVRNLTAELSASAYWLIFNI